MRELPHYGVVRGALPLYLLLVASPAHAELAAVWAVDDGTKVKADALGHPLATGNETFDGKTIKIFAARNETVAFQVILVGGGAGTKVSVSLSKIGTIENQGTSTDADTYFLGRNIELFEQVYLEVKQRSNGLSWDPPADGDHVPPGLTGPVPDPLVPLALLDGPLSVPAKRNQGIWVDVYVPKATAAGLHRGTLQVQVDGQPCALASCQLPVELTVLDATLPDEPAVKTMLWFSGTDNNVIGRYFANPGSVSAAERNKLLERHYKLGRRHQVTFFLGHDNSPTPELADRISGKAFSAGRGYYGWGEGQGQDMYSIHTYGGELNAAQATTWSDWFAQHGPSVEYFLYVWDEPGKGAYDEINQIAKAAAPVPSFVTAGYTAALDEVDIFSVLPGHYSSSAAQKCRDAGKRCWTYNGTRPFSGSFAIDDVAISPRINPWIQVKHDIGRWFYWESTYYFDFQGGRGAIDVFSDPMNFTNSWGDAVNGDGLLVYPGRDRLFPKQDRGFDGPLPSIRLKNWRRGIQDAAYLALARGAGHDQQVDAAIAALIPAVLDDATSQQVASWPDDGEAWVAARRKLASLIGGTEVPLPSDSPAPGPTDSSADGGGVDPLGEGADAGALGATTSEATLTGGCNTAARGTGRRPALTLILFLIVALVGVGLRRVG